MNYQTEHNLSLPELKKLVDKAYSGYSTKYAKHNPWLTWSSDTNAAFSFTTKGITLKGNIYLLSDKIHISVEGVPAMFQGYVEKIARPLLEKEMAKWLRKGTTNG